MWSGKRYPILRAIDLPATRPHGEHSFPIGDRCCWSCVRHTVSLCCSRCLISIQDVPCDHPGGDLGRPYWSKTHPCIRGFPYGCVCCHSSDFYDLVHELNVRVGRCHLIIAVLTGLYHDSWQRYVVQTIVRSSLTVIPQPFCRWLGSLCYGLDIRFWFVWFSSSEGRGTDHVVGFGYSWGSLRFDYCEI